MLQLLTTCLLQSLSWKGNGAFRNSSVYETPRDFRLVETQLRSPLPSHANIH